MFPRYAICLGGEHDNERWPLEGDVSPGDTFAWDDPGSCATYAVEAHIVETNSGPMWVAIPAAVAA